jgi:excisionase family DNA binding protein
MAATDSSMQMLSLTEVAERMGIGPTGVRSLVKDGGLLAVRREGVGLLVPAEQLDGAVPVKHLRPVLTLLSDAGYSADEALRWLTTADDSLPGTPLQALHENRATEVKRRAQALGF